MTTKLVLRGFFFSLFVIICVLQCASILVNYCTYPYSISISELSALESPELPGITICNNNAFSLTKLIKWKKFVGPALEKKAPSYMIEGKPQLGEDFHKFRDNLASIFDAHNYDPQSDLNNFTMDFMYSIKPENKPFIRWLDCTRTRALSIECANLTFIDSLQDRRCITIVHGGAMYHDLRKRPELFNTSRLKLGKFTNRFNQNELLKLVLDFQPEDYADLKRQVGSRIIIHDSRHVGITNALDYFVTRGYRYDFSISPNVVFQRGQPYDNCYDYVQYNLPSFKEKIDPRLPLTTTTHFHNCVVEEMLNRYKCWPPPIPYFRNDSMDPHLDIKPCKWPISSFPIFKGFESLFPGLNKTWATVRGYNRIRYNCLGRSLPACNTISYSVTVTISIWPTDMEILNDQSKKLLRHCCAMISIKHLHTHYFEQKLRNRYKARETAEDLGGLLGVWLGLSIISVYKAIQKLLNFFFYNQSTDEIKN